MPPAFKAVVFDLDGTLVDSVELIALFDARTLAAEKPQKLVHTIPELADVLGV